MEVELREIFSKPVIKELAKYIHEKEQGICKEEAVQDGHAKKKEFTVIKTVENKDHYPVSAAQKRMYVLNQFDKWSTSYNTPAVYTIRGNLDYEKLEQVFQKMLIRHESFRTSFEVVEGEPVQIIHEEVDFEVEYYKQAEGYKVKDIIKEFVRPFDLSKASLLRVGMIKITDNEHILIFDMHHIISDGVSTTIFIEETVALYSYNFV